ncbi:hypothetical protein BDZ94DRAFT_1248087 [Collybia nuda]|uniref:RING-type domain-containing protein n=1 Tax=Collybia nuda TaxID=64659 RepID=A0A9P6CIR5_9AGAR|nr:hypothetical protein BDZ94DRAFT_1248087 [Collybia nuda]
MSFASWYQHHYSTWNRTRRIQQAPYVARTDSNIARAATAMRGADNAASNGGNAADGSSNNKDKKTQDSLFGPNIGVVSSGPTWTTVSEKKVLTDELTPDIVNSWIEKSKEVSQPTTTLQALVNLKRPTIRLSPLTSDDTTSPNPSDVHHHHHGLEFEYDCDAPKCGIYVHVLLSQEHPDAPISGAASGLSKLLVFEAVVEGGFGRLLKLEEGALLELGRFEHTPNANGSTTSLISPVSGPRESTSTPTSESPAPGSGLPDPAGPASNPRHSRRRFTHFHFRKRSQGRSVAGPALAVMDAEPAPATDSKGKDEVLEGVRVTIRLAALDEQGTELASPNEQVTYLHVVRFGPKNEGAESEEDSRPWVVKVVKREATIGPHTFHLHEIYGLTSSSAAAAHTPAPTAPLPSSPTSDSHTYPPTAVVPVAAENAEDDPSSECLLCLSSPREVVLLPCRHLVACKECALNMVEFGAGGHITQTEEPVANAEGGDAAPTASEGTDAAATPAAPVVPAPTRRKRKAKGWFCPVCRQPYTSLLRITTTPPPPTTEVDKEAAVGTGGNPTSEGNDSTGEGRSGLLGGNFAPAFLRGLSFNRTTPADIENQVATARVGPYT